MNKLMDEILKIHYFENNYIVRSLKNNFYNTLLIT